MRALRTGIGGMRTPGADRVAQNWVEHMPKNGFETRPWRGQRRRPEAEGCDYNDAVSGTVQTNAEAEDPSGRRPFTAWERFLLAVISWAVYVAVRLIAPTLRYAVSCEENSPRSLEQR